MRHHNANRKFGRTRNQRRTLLKSLALNLIIKGRIETTLAKAKELRPYIEKLVTSAKSDTLAKRRLLTGRLLNRKSEVKKLFEEIAPKYKTTKGGYTKVVKMPRRGGDASHMAVIEFI
jgi:large subunit ribosomal protein L17